MGFMVRDLACAVQFTNCGIPHIDNYRQFNYLSDFTENCLKGVYMITMIPVKSFFFNQPAHLKIVIKIPNAPYMSIIGWGEAH